MVPARTALNSLVPPRAAVIETQGTYCEESNESAPDRQSVALPERAGRMILPVTELNKLDDWIPFPVHP